jgi:hypothetical protein
MSHLEHLTELIRSLAELKIQAAKVREFEPELFANLIDRAIHEVGQQMRHKENSRERKSHSRRGRA